MGSGVGGRVGVHLACPRGLEPMAEARGERPVASVACVRVWVRVRIKLTTQRGHQGLIRRTSWEDIIRRTSLGGHH